MHKVVWIIGIVIIAISIITLSTDADAQADKEQLLTKHKFSAPVDASVVRASWKTRGYGDFYERSYMQGWSRDAHTHGWDILLTLIKGRMEFIIEGKRYVLKPGDELHYSANAVISARNLYEGTSVMLSTRH